MPPSRGARTMIGMRIDYGPTVTTDVVPDVAALPRASVRVKLNGYRVLLNYGGRQMSEMNKKHDGSRTVRALKVSLVTALALWASPVVGAPPPGSPAATVYVCIHDSVR